MEWGTKKERKDKIEKQRKTNACGKKNYIYSGIATDGKEL